MRRCARTFANCATFRASVKSRDILYILSLTN